MLLKNLFKVLGISGHHPENQLKMSCVEMGKHSCATEAFALRKGGISYIEYLTYP